MVDLKGKVACEISSADELTLTELMFNGVFKDIKVEEMISLLSCFVWREKINDAAKPREELDLLYAQLQDTARRVAQLQLECKVITEFQFVTLLAFNCTFEDYTCSVLFENSAQISILAKHSKNLITRSILKIDELKLIIVPITRLYCFSEANILFISSTDFELGP